MCHFLPEFVHNCQTQSLTVFSNDNATSEEILVQCNISECSTVHLWISISFKTSKHAKERFLLYSLNTILVINLQFPLFSAQCSKITAGISKLFNHLHD